MKKYLLLFLFLFFSPLIVRAETYYFDYTEYFYSDEEIEESNEVEVNKIFDGNKWIYKYRFRNYLILPDNLVINSRDFNFTDIMETNISLDQFIINKIYNLNAMNNCEALVEIHYRDNFIRKSLYIDIDYYINVPEFIIIDSYDFDIWNYIDPDMPMKDHIRIEGEYDLNTNGEYYLTISYDDVFKEIKLIVDNENNENDFMDKEEILTEEEKNYNVNKKIIYDQNKKIYNTYNNSYPVTKNEENSSCDLKCPLNTRVIYSSCVQDNPILSYISYGFYSIIIVLLSIIVVRKK